MTVPAGLARGEPGCRGLFPAPDAKALRDAGQGLAVVLVKPAREAGLAGRASADGGMLPADGAEADGAAGLPAASGGVAVPPVGERLAVRAAAAAGSRGRLAALDAERTVALAPAAVDAGAVCPAAPGEAVVAARIAFGGRVLCAPDAEAGLAPLVAPAPLDETACLPMLLPAGRAEPPAGFFSHGAALCAEAAVAAKQAAFPGGLAVAGAAALDSRRAVFRAVRRGNPAAVQAEAARGEPAPRVPGI